MRGRHYVLKFIIIVFFGIQVEDTNGQRLENTEWIIIVVENTVKGKTEINQRLTNKPIKYYFLQDSVLIAIDESYSTKLDYTIKENVLSIGHFVKYRIDSLSEEIIVMSDVPMKGNSADKITSFTLLNTDFVFDYLKSTQQIGIINDSLILTNELFCPTYNGDLSGVFMLERSAFAHTTYRGSFTLSRDGYIRDIQITLHKKGTKDDLIRINNILQSTKGNWIIPPTPKPYDCKIEFSVSTKQVGDFSGVNINLNPKR